MSNPDYVPEQGDVVWIDLDPQIGHEHFGRRPAVVLSPAWYNGSTGLAVVCPVTTRRKEYQFELPIPPGLPVTGVVLTDQVKSQDWMARNAILLCRVPHAFVQQIADSVTRLIR